jgi:hypothetical protein
MEREDVHPQQRNADTNTSVRSARNVDMVNWTAKSMRDCELLGRRPHYLRHNIYCNDETRMLSRPSAEWTETARPLASVPVGEFANTVACQTIDQHRGLLQWRHQLTWMNSKVYSPIIQTQSSYNPC